MFKVFVLLCFLVMISQAQFDFHSFKRCSTTSCGGIAGIACCSNYFCQLEGSYPDAAGQCVEKTSRMLGCSEKGQMCGVYGLVCCSGRCPDRPGYNYGFCP